MQNNFEGAVLLRVFENVRGLSKFFINNLGDTNIHEVHELNGVRLNSIHWLIAHLAWTENELILKGVGNIDAGPPWLEEYGFGSKPDEIKTKPDLPELTRTLDDIHEKSKQILGELTNEELEANNHLDFTFGGSKSKRNLIMHTIRHEPMHIGQLTWAMKLSGKKPF